MAGEFVLAASSDDQGILATDLHSSAVVATFEEASAQPNAFGMVGSNSDFVFAVHAKKSMWTVWPWGDKKPRYRATLPEKTTAMVFSSDAVFCVAGMASGSVYVWQVGTGCLLRSWQAHFREVTQLLISQDESFLVTASADATVHVYNLADVLCDANPKPFHSWSGHALPVTSLAQLPGGGLQQAIVTASLDRSVRVWDVGTGRSVTVRSLPSPVRSVCASPTGSEVLCACSDGELRVLFLKGERSDAALFSGHTGAVLSCDYSADGTRAASCSEADRVRIWETRTRQCISQVHSNRNIQICSVRIVRRPAMAPGLPAFQPFQRLLTSPEAAPVVPLCLPGRAQALEEELAACSAPGDFLDRAAWAQVAGMGTLAQSQHSGGELLAAKEDATRWAAAAASLYDELALATSTAPKADQPQPPAPPATGERAPGAGAVPMAL